MQIDVGIRNIDVIIGDIIISTPLPTSKVHAYMISYISDNGTYCTVNLNSGVIGKQYKTTDEMMQDLNQRWKIHKILRNNQAMLSEIQNATVDISK